MAAWYDSNIKKSSFAERPIPFRKLDFLNSCIMLCGLWQHGRKQERSERNLYMTNKIMDGIGRALNMEFGGRVPICSGNPEQGMSKPCFFMGCTGLSCREFPGNRHFRQNQFCIQYFLPDNQTGEECSQAMERILACLTGIKVDGDLTRSTKMRCEVLEHGLKVFVNYDMFVYQKEEEIPMETIETTIV